MHCNGSKFLTALVICIGLLLSTPNVQAADATIHVAHFGYKGINDALDDIGRDIGAKIVAIAYTTNSLLVFYRITDDQYNYELEPLDFTNQTAVQRKIEDMASKGYVLVDTADFRPERVALFGQKNGVRQVKPRPLKFKPLTGTDDKDEFLRRLEANLYSHDSTPRQVAACMEVGSNYSVAVIDCEDEPGNKPRYKVVKEHVSPFGYTTNILIAAQLEEVKSGNKLVSAAGWNGQLRRHVFLIFETSQK